MTFPEMVPNAWGAANWLLPAGLLILVALGAIIWTYAQARTSGGWKALMIAMKLAAFLLLAICLLEPMVRYSRPEKGANLMVVMADDSQSLQIKDRGQSETRETRLKQNSTKIQIGSINWQKILMSGVTSSTVGCVRYPILPATLPINVAAKCSLTSVWFPLGLPDDHRQGLCY
jgi:hypothetical protein